MLIVLLGLRLAEVSSTVRKYLGEIFSRINSQTLVKSVWNRIRRIKGKDTSNIFYILSVSDRKVPSHHDIANALADKFHIILRPLHLLAKKLKSRL